ncbi:MAG: hypothetical protein ABH814_02375 [bacterium]
MKAYQTKSAKLAGSAYKEVHKKAIAEFNKIKVKTKRRPYVRSAYFNGDKVFFTYFWQHLSHKPRRMRVQRLKYFPCAIELIEKSKQDPEIKSHPKNSSEFLYRFIGKTKGSAVFFVQIKQNKRTGKKHLMSFFGRE